MTRNDALERWLEIATHRLAAESTARVREEIRDHYESARAEAIASGAADDAASLEALESLGDPGKVNRNYRRVLLTTTEARWLDRLQEADSMSPSVVPVCLSLVALMLTNSIYKQDIREIIGCVAILVVGALHLLPPARAAKARGIRRYLRWGLMAGLPCSMTHWEVSLFVAVMFLIWLVPIEWRLAMLRRKLPVERWPAMLRK